jgi:uncharacterized membrane protein
MKEFVNFVKATLVGGALFLVPMIVLLAILGKAQQIASKIVTPLSKLIPVEALAGEVGIRILAVLLIVLVCFLAGVLAKKRSVKTASNWLEDHILIHVPGYTLIKSMTGSMAGTHSEADSKPVLARIEDSWQLGFVVERLEAGHLAVFVPGAPNAMSGSVYFMSAERVRPLDIPLPKAMKLMRGLGVGSAALVPGTALSGWIDPD